MSKEAGEREKREKKVEGVSLSRAPSSGCLQRSPLHNLTLYP